MSQRPSYRVVVDAYILYYIVLNRSLYQDKKANDFLVKNLDKDTLNIANIMTFCRNAL